MPQSFDNVDQLLTLDDAAFVTGAYRSILKREPDPNGFAGYVAQLRAGVAKERIVVAIATSEEGRASEATLPGIDALCLGFPERPRSGVSRLVHRLRGTAAEHLAGQVRAVDNRLSRIEAQQGEVAERDQVLQLNLAEQLNQVITLLKQLSERVAHAEAREANRIAEAGRLEQAIESQHQLSLTIVSQLQALCQTNGTLEATLGARIDSLSKAFEQSRQEDPNLDPFLPLKRTLGEEGRRVLMQVRRAAAEATQVH